MYGTETYTASDFDAFRAMQARLNKEETEAAESRLIPDGTFPSTVVKFTRIPAQKLPTADIIGYNLETSVDVEGVSKRHWVDVYFTPVSGAKGLILPSKLGIQLAKAMGMAEGDTWESVLTRAQVLSFNQRISKQPASNGYKAKNKTWAISLAK